MRKLPAPLVPGARSLPRRRPGRRGEPVHVARCRPTSPGREAGGAGPTAVEAWQGGTSDTRPGERRRLAAILAVDLVGYSRLLAEDEVATLAALRAVRAGLLEPLAAAHGGWVFAAAGDGFLAEFPSSVLALRCALALQAGPSGSEPDRLGARRLSFRIGVHQGDVVEEDGIGVMGIGVVVAVRLQALAEPGGVCVSGRVREDIAGKLVLAAEDLGERALKNVPWPVRAFLVRPVAPAAASPGLLPSAESPRFDPVGARGRACPTSGAGHGPAVPSLVRRLLVVARGLIPRRGHAANMRGNAAPSV